MDKVKAIQHRWRIKELTLLGLSLLGGSIGGMIAMFTTRHKINSIQFTFGLPMIIFTQIVVLGYWILQAM